MEEPWSGAQGPSLPYSNRAQAGRILAGRLGQYADGDTIVLALPRGGVPVGAQIARALAVPLDVMVVRKIGVPGYRELAVGAVATGGVTVLNPEIARYVDQDELDRVVREELRELARRERLYRGDRPPPALAGRTVILVDDGLATGATMRAAVTAARKLDPVEIVVAAPVGAADTLRALSAVADRVVCPATPAPFRAIGLWYRDFGQLTDTDVQALLAGASGPPDASSS